MMLEVLQHTPRWVYAVFAVVLYTGISACFRSNQSPRDIAILPLVFAGLMIFGLDPKSSALLWLLLIEIGALSLGAALSVAYYSRRPVTFDSIRQKIGVPGDPAVLTFSLMFFAAKYWVGYQRAVAGMDASTLDSIDAFVSGLAVGVFLARAGLLLRRYYALRRASIQSAQAIP